MHVLAGIDLAFVFVHFAIYEFWMHIFYVIQFFSKRSTYLSPYYFLKYVGIANRDWFVKLIIISNKVEKVKNSNIC